MSTARYLRLQLRERVKTLVLIPGLDPDRVARLIGASFKLGSERVVALQAVLSGSVVPLPILCQRPALFADSAYSLLLRDGVNESKGGVGLVSAAKPAPEPTQRTSRGRGLEDKEIARIQTVREATVLSRLSPAELEQLFLSSRDAKNRITEGSLSRALQPLVARYGSAGARSDGAASRALAQSMASDVMRLCDQNSDGYVDATEFLVATSIVSKGSASEKVGLVFKCLDKDNDGFISFDEMVEYMTLFFKTTFNLSGARVQANVSPVKLGYATALSCFHAMDKNHDGRVSREEFAEWYLSKAKSKDSSVAFFGQST